MSADRTLNKGKARVAILAPESYPNIWGEFAGGITEYVAGISQGYAELGHEVHIFARASTTQCIRWNGVTVHYTKAAKSRGRFSWFVLLVDELRTLRAFRAASRLDPFDVVEVIDWNTPAVLSLFATPHGRVILKLHGPSDFVATLNDRPNRGVGRVIAGRERYLARTADFLCSADEGLARAMARLWKLPQVPEIIPDPVRVPTTRPKRTQPSGKELRIIAVGRLERRKDQVTLIRALNRLVAARVPWKATLVGPDTDTGPNDSSYREVVLQCAEAETLERVEFIEFAARDELWDLYKDSDVAVVCTLDGNYGYSTLDAMAAGIAVVTTTPSEGSSTAYVRDGDTGIVFIAGDDLGLADALARLARDRQLRDNVAEAGRRHVLSSLAPRRIAGMLLERLGVGV